MLKRRAEQAGYEPDVHPHRFRHIRQRLGRNDGAEGDLMRLMGWTDRSMLDLYAEEHLQMQRAIAAKRRRGDLY